MPEANSYVFNHREIAEVLVKHQNLHEGFWGIYLEFGIGAANVQGPGDSSLLPAAIVPLLKIGIQRFPTENSLTVDAAKVNPVAKSRPKSGARKKVATSKG
jgi:hypothetical protein